MFRLAAMTSASLLGSSMLTTATLSSSGSDGERLMISWNRLPALRASADVTRVGRVHHRAPRSRPADTVFPIDADDPHPFQALDEHANAVVRKFQHPHHAGNAAAREQLVGSRLFEIGIRLQGHGQQAIAGHHLVNEPDRLGAGHQQRGYHVGEHHHVAQRQNRQPCGQIMRGRLGLDNVRQRFVFRRVSHLIIG